MNVRENIRGKLAAWFRLFFISFLTVVFPLVVNAQEAAYVTLRVEQVFIKNSTRNVDEVFAYKLTALGNDCPMPSGTADGTYSFTLTGTDAVNIPVTFTDPGIYQYEVSVDLTLAAPGNFCDPRIYKIAVFVKAAERTLTAQMVVQTDDGVKSDGIRFENSYTPLASDPRIMVDPSVQKTVSGNPSGSSTFSFTLTARDPAFPMPEGSTNGVKTITITGSGEKDFGCWAYTREGTYCYDIAEVILSDTRYTYDESVYLITDAVKDVNGQLVVTRSVTNEGNKQVGSCIFINTYKKGSGGGSSGGNGGVSGAGAAAAGGGNPETGVGSAGENQVTEETVENTGGASVLGNVPKVGDDVKIELYIAMLCSGMIGAGGCVQYLIRTNGRKEKR